MKTVKADTEGVIKLYCSCVGCEDKLIVEVFKEFHYEDTFIFDIQYDDPPNLWQRIKRAFDYIKGYKVEELSYDCILINADQAKELAKCLLQRIEEYKKFLKSKEKKQL